MRVLGRHLLVSGVHPLVEGDGFPVEPVLRVARNSRQSRFHGKIQQQSPIGREVSGGLRLQPLQGLEVQATAVTLIRKGRVTEPIAEHDLAALQSWSDHFVDQFGASGREEECLRPGREPGLLRPQ